MLCFPTIDRVRVFNISAANLQQNQATQMNWQTATSRSTRAWDPAQNTSSQVTSSAQLGSAYNNIGINSTARLSDVKVTKVAAENVQLNSALQTNVQKASAISPGYALATNQSWQTAGNYQSGSAFNNINIQA